MSVIHVIKRLLGIRLKLSGLEMAILGSVARELRDRDARLWNAQVAALNKVHRSPDGKEVNFWAVGWRGVDFPKELCFDRSDVFKIAVVDVTANAGVLALRGRVWCVDGHLFSIEYKRSFRDFEKLAHGDWQVHCHIENYPSQHARPER